MHGQNPLRPPESGDGTMLQVQEIFPTIQGEGPHAGVPAVFIRLGGCNLACDFCDTEFESFSGMAVNEILAEVQALRGGRALAVITGGEPLRQNIAPLCELLIAEGFTVQVETNGTLMRPLPEGVQLICSPKNTGQGYAKIRGDVLERCIAVKFIVSARHPFYGDIAPVGQEDYALPVYIQPMDEGDAALNAANTALAVKLAQERGGYVSLQLHKLLGVR